MFKKCLLVQLWSREMCVWHDLCVPLQTVISDPSLLQGWGTVAVALTFVFLSSYGILQELFFGGILLCFDFCSNGLKFVQRSWEVSWDLHDLETHKVLWIAPDKMLSLTVPPSYVTSSWSEGMKVIGWNPACKCLYISLRVENRACFRKKIRGLIKCLY